MANAKTVGAVERERERATLYTTAKLHTSNLIEINKGENDFFID